jgi:hypothetical protein
LSQFVVNGVFPQVLQGFGSGIRLSGDSARRQADSTPPSPKASFPLQRDVVVVTVWSFTG